MYTERRKIERKAQTASDSFFFFFFFFFFYIALGRSPGRAKESAVIRIGPAARHADVPGQLDRNEAK